MREGVIETLSRDDIKDVLRIVRETNLTDENSSASLTDEMFNHAGNASEFFVFKR